MIQDTKWYDNLFCQCFEDYEKSVKNIKLSISRIDAAARVKKLRYKRTSMFY